VRKNMAHEEAQQHPIKLYLVVWGWLFVLSTCSYLVDYFGLQGMLRWSLILLFMIVKAGLIVAVFMHMAFERLALMYAILVPPGAVLLFVTIMAFESDYTHVTRVAFFGPEGAYGQTEMLASAKSGANPGNTAVPPDQLKNKAEKLALDVSEPEEGRDGALLGGAAATNEAGKAGPASGNTVGVAAIQNDIAAAAKAGVKEGTAGTTSPAPAKSPQPPPATAKAAPAGSIALAAPSAGQEPVRSSDWAELESVAINFPTNSSRIPSHSMPILKRIADIIKQLPAGTVVEVNGYTDSTGNPTWNMELSLRRANSVYWHLVGAGVHPAMMSPKGKGHGSPSAWARSNGGTEGRGSVMTERLEPNERHVEFHIVLQEE
jgi:cytochrome c oxidase subunit IV